MDREVEGLEGEGGFSELIMEPLNVIAMSIPACVHKGLPVPFGRIAIGVIPKHITRVVENNIQNNVDPVSMSGTDQCPQVFSLPKMRIDIQKVLNAISMIRFLKRYLLENRTNPNGSHTKAFQVSQFTRQSA